MNKLNNLKYKFMEFMRGRNGSDELYYAMIVMSLALDVADWFINSRIYSAVTLMFFALTMYRFFSKNLVQRQKENAKFLQVIAKVKNKDCSRNPYDDTPKKPSKIKKKIDACKIRFRDRKTHVFKKCPGCQATIRLPKRKGEHTVCCPRCSTDFKVKIR